jgi:formyltetrahydrofolate deformylase
VAGFVAEHDGNILDADQHTDSRYGEFFMRLEIDQNTFGLGPESFEDAWRPLARRLVMRWHMHWGDHVKRVAILASRESHCLSDLLWRHSVGEHRIEIPLVISNHLDLRRHVEIYGIPYVHLPVTSASKSAQEERLRELIQRERIDLIVLARYMQILSPEFVRQYPERIINIHHSFLPAFAGPRPYHQAFERGVKIIGATSHYVTEDLDQGPIIAQATLSIDHRDSIDDLIRKGRDLERVVLATAVRQHIQDKILVSNGRTVVFD